MKKKPKKEKLADELFGVVMREIGRSIYETTNDGGVRMHSAFCSMGNWIWGSKRNFLLTKKGDTYMSFAQAVDEQMLYGRLPKRLKSMVDVMLESSTLEEMKIKFAVAGLLGENSPAGEEKTR